MSFLSRPDELRGERWFFLACPNPPEGKEWNQDAEQLFTQHLEVMVKFSLLEGWPSGLRQLT
jgi:hypothetical protein